ncbi:MAG: hypothetical protein AAFQ22_10045 [Pseudomonadota bacterium]
MAEAMERALLKRIVALGQASRSEAEQRIVEVFQDGLVSRAEAESLFALTPKFTDSSESWNGRFIESICDYLLSNEAPKNWVSDGEADWLMGLISGRVNGPLEVDLDLLLAVLRKAEGAPPRLGTFALQAVCDHIVAKGSATDTDVERTRRAVYAQSSDGGLWVTREEAGILFSTNDKIAKARNVKSWNDLFARAIGNHLLAAAHPDPITEGRALARETWLKSDGGGILDNLSSAYSSGNWFQRVTYDSKKAAQAREAAKEAAIRQGSDVTAEENDWFIKRLGWDNTVSPAERALIDFLRQEAPGFSHGLAAATA